MALASGAAPEPDTAYLMWQTLAGAWPLDRERLTGYLRKAMREAKNRTSWTDPDPEYESQVLTFAELVLDDDELTGQIGRFVAGLDGDARANALGAKLVQLTMPGVADTYQGCELAGLRLVDPDNREPADFARCRNLLAALDAGEPSLDAGLDAAPLDAAKLLVTSAALRLRREHPDWFAGEYAPLAAEGPAARHAVGYARGGHAVTVVTRLPAGLRRRGGWAGTTLPLPHAGPWRNVLTGASVPGARPLLSELLQRLPVALLVPADHARGTGDERVPGLGPDGGAGRGPAGVGGHGRRGAAAHAPGRHPRLVGGGPAGGGRLRHGLRVPGGRR